MKIQPSERKENKRENTTFYHEKTQIYFQRNGNLKFPKFSTVITKFLLEMSNELLLRINVEPICFSKIYLRLPYRTKMLVGIC